MYKLLLLLLPMVGYTQNKPDFTIRFDRRAYVKISYCHNPRSLPVTVGTFNLLPANQNPEQSDTVSAGSGNRVFAVAVRTPQQGYVAIGRVRYDLYLLPADTVKLSINFDGDTTWRDRYLNYTGSLAPLQAYYRNRNLTLGLPGKHQAVAANNAPDLSAYQRTMDSLFWVEQVFFENYRQKHPLPDWFLTDLRNQLLYGDAALRENTVFCRRFMNKGREEPIPDGYFAYQKSAPVANALVVHLTEYWQYIDSYFFLTSGQKIGQPTNASWLSKDIEKARGLFVPVVAEYYKAVALSSLASAKLDEALQLINIYAPTFHDKQLVDVIRADVKARIKILEPGDPAPAFFLSDPLDSLVSLNSFRGNVVLLCFWFPGCKPCVAEFPHENALVDQFKDKPVRIVGVGTTNGRQAWLAAIEKHKLKTVHLYANESWQKTLERKYAINGYPHYVLIDQRGRVVKNFAPRPSQNVADDINRLLR